MKPFDTPPGTFDAIQARFGRGWRVFIDELVVDTRIGIHAHEHVAPQPVVLDASLVYRGEPSETGDVAHGHALIDYERYCERVTAYLHDKPHTRTLETLAVELAALSFGEWPSLDALTLALHKPKVCEGTRRVGARRIGARRIGVELDWTRADYDAWCARRVTRDATRDAARDVPRGSR